MKKKNCEKNNCRQQNVDASTLFIRNVSHKLGIDSMAKHSPTASILATTPGNNIPVFVDQLFNIYKEYNRKIKDIVDYSEIINGNFVSVNEPLLVRNILSYASSNARDRIKNIADLLPLVDVCIDEGVPISELIGDSRSITMILEELVFNGLRHSMNNKVVVRVWSDKYDPCMIFFSIENEGITIPIEDLPTIFEPFKNTSVCEGVVQGAGVGLGLSKCKKLSDLLGWTICVESYETTIFTLGVKLKHSKELMFNNIPLEVNHEREDRLPSNIVNPCDTETVSVLIVDDSPLILKMFDKMLTGVGIDVEVCAEPLLALYKVSLCKYDAIFLDNIMPVMTGIACAHEIRNGETKNKHTPILVVTADPSTETRQLTSYITNSILIEKPARLSVVVRSLFSVIKDKSKVEYLNQYFSDIN